MPLLPRPLIDTDPLDPWRAVGQAAAVLPPAGEMADRRWRTRSNNRPLPLLGFTVPQQYKEDCYCALPWPDPPQPQPSLGPPG